MHPRVSSLLGFPLESSCTPIRESKSKLKARALRRIMVLFMKADSASIAILSTHHQVTTVNPVAQLTEVLRVESVRVGCQEAGELVMAIVQCRVRKILHTNMKMTVHMQAKIWAGGRILPLLMRIRRVSLVVNPKVVEGIPRKLWRQIIKSQTLSHLL